MGCLRTSATSSDRSGQVRETSRPHTRFEKEPATTEEDTREAAVEGPPTLQGGRSEHPHVSLTSTPASNPYGVTDLVPRTTARLWSPSRKDTY